MTNTVKCELLASTNEAAQIVVCAASAVSGWSLAGPAVIAVSAIIAYRSLKSAQKIARTKATIDLIEKVESTAHYRTLQSTFAYYKRTEAFERLHNPQEDKDRSDRSAINDFLSHYELVSIGIDRKILDEQFYKDWMANPFVRDWNAASNYVQRERWKWNGQSSKWEYYDRLFEFYQKVAMRFSEEAINLTANSGGQPDKPDGPGDVSLP